MGLTCSLICLLDVRPGLSPESGLIIWIFGKIQMPSPCLPSCLLQGLQNRVLDGDAPTLLAVFSPSSPHPLGSSWSLFAISTSLSLVGPQPVQLQGVIQFLCLPSLNFMRFLTTHFSSLSRSKNTQEAVILFTTPCFGIICKLTECTLSPRLLINMLSGIATGVDLQGQSLVNGCLLDFLPLITAPQATQPTQFSIYPIMHLTSPYLTCLPVRILWETMSKAC